MCRGIPPDEKIAVGIKKMDKKSSFLPKCHPPESSPGIVHSEGAIIQDKFRHENA